MFNYFHEKSTVNQFPKYSNLRFLKVNEYTPKNVLVRVKVQYSYRKNNLRQIAQNRYFFRCHDCQKAKKLFFFMELEGWMLPCLIVSFFITSIKIISWIVMRWYLTFFKRPNYRFALLHYHNRGCSFTFTKQNGFDGIISFLF